MQLSNAIYENEIRDYFMKNVRIQCFFSGHYFSLFGLNAKIYSVNVCILYE